MEAVCLCPFVATSFVWQANTGAYARTVIIKATFVLQQGTALLASEQEPIWDRDRHEGDDPRRSVRIPSDRVPYKPQADVLLVGHAYAPEKQPTRNLVTRFVVGDMDKSIEVWCDRKFRVADGQVLEGSRFTSMPLCWERAAGGPDSANPVGMRFDAAPDAYGTVLIANLQPAGHFVAKRSDTFGPVCYAPIASVWPGRTHRLGRLSRSFFDSDWADKPFPEGVDPRFFQAAPNDQIVSEIRPNERIILENLHPAHARLTTTLPGLHPRAMAVRATGEQEDIALVGDTLWVDNDRGLCCVVWRGRIGLRHPQEAGKIVVRLAGEESGDHGLVVSDVRMPSPEPELSTLDEDLVAMTMIGAVAPAASGAVMPFLGGDKPKETGREMPRQIGNGALPFSSVGAAALRVPDPPVPVVGVSTKFVEVARAVDAPVVAPPAYVKPPPVASVQPAAESVWASGFSTPLPAPAKETIGEMVATAAAVAVVAPSVDRATQDGALAASNAAAGATPWSVPKREARPSNTELDMMRAEAPTEMLQLLWYDADSVARIRRVPAWKNVFEEFERSPRSRDLEIVDGAREPWEAEDRQEIFEVLSMATPTDGKGVEEALDGAVGERGKFTPPIVLLAGELDQQFDELEALKAAMSTATPLVTPADEQLRVSVAVAKEFVQVPGLVATPAVCEGLTTRIRDAFVREKKSLPSDYLDQQIERGLLTNRSYQKRDVFGGTHLRCLICLPGEKVPIVGYLPADVAKKLPMWKRFRARLIVEVHAAQDQYESAPRAVMVLALARVGSSRR